MTRPSNADPGPTSRYLADLKQRPEIEFTLIQFDSTSTDLGHSAMPIGKVPDLTDEIFQPRHSTPLIDAACITIKRVKETYKPTDQVVVTILTDGHENASTELLGRRFRPNAQVADLAEVR